MKIIARSAHSSRLLAATLAAIAIACRGDVSGDSTPTAAGGARHTVLIDGTAPSCTQCTLVVVDSLQIGATSDRDIPQRVPNYILRDGHGTHYLIFNGWGNKPILRYDSAGRFLGKLGGYGRGPGEYEMSGSAFLGAADSVFVMEFGARRGQLFAPDAAFARALMPSTRRIIGAAAGGTADMYAFAGNSAAALGGTSVDGRVPAPDTVVPHLIRVAADGTVKDSFPVFAPRMLMPLRTPQGMVWRETRVAASPVPSHDGTVWTVYGSRLEQHAADGSSIKVIGIVQPNFRPPLMTYAEADSIVEEWKSKDPATVLRSDKSATQAPARFNIQVGADGLLWLTRTIRAPGADTIEVKPEFLSPDEAPTEGTIPRNTQDRLRHTIVDVIDPEVGQLIARMELPFDAVTVAPGYVGRVRVADDGHFLIHVYRLGLNRN